jgi:hypothetical protein
MTFRHWLWTGLSAYSIFAVVACGNNLQTKDASVAAVPGVSAAGCPAGSTLVTTNGYPMCQGANGLSTPIYQNTMTGLTGYSSDNYCYRSLTITNNAQAQLFLKNAMGVCDQNASTGGNAGCDAWVAGTFRINLAVGGPALGLTFYAYPQQTGYYYSLPSFADFVSGMFGFPVYNTYAYATRDPLSLNMSTFQINNSQGFEGRQNGDLYTLANRSLIQIQVNNGLPGAPYFTYTIAYEGVTFISGTLVKSDNYAHYCGN